MTVLQFTVALIAVAAGLSAFMAAGWLVWRKTRNSGWIDTTWTYGLALVGCAGALAASLATNAFTTREMLVILLVAIWALRLGLHIASRTAGITDDPRYAAMIRDWGPDADRRMFWLAQKQALVSIPLALSILLAGWNPVEIRLQDFIAVGVLVTAIAGEALADRQLRQFRADPANKDRVCDSGLWKWSRHPNYFFEWLGWLAYPLLAIDLTGNFPWGWIALAGPICMYWLLVHVSGIPPLEAHMLARRGERYRAYQARTSAFFPAPPVALGERDT